MEFPFPLLKKFGVAFPNFGLVVGDIFEEIYLRFHFVIIFFTIFFILYF